MNQLFPTFRADMLTALGNWGTYSVYCVALSSTLDQTDIDNVVYTFYADLPPGAILSNSQELLGKSVSPTGVAESSFITFQDLTSGSGEVKVLILFNETGDPATSQLLAYMDTGQDIPFPAAGGVITVAWSDVTAGGFFRA